MLPSAREICDLALRELKSLEFRGNRKGERRRQLHVDFIILKNDEKQEMSHFMERFVKPCMTRLASAIPPDVIFLDLELPSLAIDSAKSEFLRFIIDDYFSPIYDKDADWNGPGKPKPIGFEEIRRGHFDVLFELA